MCQEEAAWMETNARWTIQSGTKAWKRTNEGAMSVEKGSIILQDIAEDQEVETKELVWSNLAKGSRCFNQYQEGQMVKKQGFHQEMKDQHKRNHQGWREKKN